MRSLYLMVLIASFSNALYGQFFWKNESNYKLYEHAITDAMSPDSSEIVHNLVEIKAENKQLVWNEINGEPYVLTVSWKQNVSFYQAYVDSAFYNTGNYPIWVSTAPELYNRMNDEKYTEVNLRLKQLLGLPPNSEYSYFVEFWVKPEDLFRPSPDPEITDNECELCFPAGIDSIHINWINANRISRYYSCDLYDKYPWTQLGYTYDWNPKNKSHVGLSEFVIRKNANIMVKAIYTTMEYLNLN